MLKQETMIKLRNRGAAIVAGVATYMMAGSVVIAQSSAQDGLDAVVPVGSDNRTEIFGADGVFERIVNLLLFLVGAISVIMLIIGGIRYVVSAGDQNQVTGAKNTIMYAIVGIVVSVLAWGIVNFILTRLYTTTP